MTLAFGESSASFDKAKVVILPVPYGKTVSYKKGTENGPRAILEASDNMELFDEEINEEICNIGINTLAPLEVKDVEPEEMVSIVEKGVSDIFREKKFPVILGGEHSVTLGAVRAAKKHYKDLSILYFDAHYDLKDSYRGSKYSHACVARRLVEMTDVVEVGVRSLSKEENDFLKDGNIKIINMLDVIKRPDWYNIAKGYLSENVYISIDLDVFDPAVMPSVGTPEPGGIGWYSFLEAMRSIVSDKRIVGFDVVELCPVKDMIAADFTAARLIYKMLGYIFFRC